MTGAAAGTLVPASGGRSARFVATLRSRPGIARLGAEGGTRLVARVELPELWDTIAFDVRDDTPVLVLKRDALARFGLGRAHPEDFVLKLRGFEVLDEGASVAYSGARDGSTYLLTYRRRRPVR